MLTVRVFPSPAYTERDERSQYLSCDFWIENTGGAEYAVEEIQVSARDAAGALVLRRFINRNGMQPAIATIGETVLKPGGHLFVYNPFHTFDGSLELSTLTFEFTLVPASGARERLHAEVQPVPYESHTALRLPVTQRCIIFDGHDYCSHHRRQDQRHPFAVRLGIQANPVRYAYDFCVVDARGDLFRDAGERNEDWLGFGSQLVVPGDGTVISARGAMPDNSARVSGYNEEQLLQDLSLMLGNHALIDHGKGEVSSILHMKQGSTLVRVGERVRAGQPVGQLGSSGDSFLPHLRYNVTAGAEMRTAEGLPSYFRSFRRIQGSRSVDVALGRVDTGEIVEPI